jgi:hypothetical protein
VTRKCRQCNKQLSASCDYCHSLNVRDSTNHPNTLDCNNCHRSAMPKLKPALETCHECEVNGGKSTKAQQI